MVITREFLAQYVYLESELKRIRRRLKYYETHPMQGEHGVVSGSMKNFPYAACHFVVGPASIKSDEQRNKDIKQLAIDLKGNEQLFQDMKLEIELFLETTPELKNDLEMKNILRMKYVEGMKDKDIAKKTGYDRSTICKKIDRFLERYENPNNNELSHNSHL